MLLHGLVRYQYHKGDFMAHAVKGVAPFVESMTGRLAPLWEGLVPDECRNPRWHPTLNTSIGPIFCLSNGEL